MRRYGSILNSNQEKILTMNNERKTQKSFLASLKEMSITADTKDLEAKEELYFEITRISEAGCYAGWNIDVEFFLWQAISGGSREFGALAITEQEIAYVKTLSEQSGGWWHWNDESEKTVFIPMNEWQEIYQNFSEKYLN